tara:strand:+ start:6087 stop:6467 length:381 start_codon:yes stop_codon:yes gene_type:complete
MRIIIFSFICLLVFSLSAFAEGNPRNGRQIFKKKCKACHRLTGSKFVGPGLAGVTKRRSEEWLHKWIQDPKAMKKKGDPIALEIDKKFKKNMRKYKLMQIKNNRDDIIAYLKEMDKKNLEIKRTQK